MLIEFLTGKVVEAVTNGKYGVQTNPDFKTEMGKAAIAETSPSDKFYNSGTLVVIDDQNHKLIPRFNIVRKK